MKEKKKKEKLKNWFQSFFQQSFYFLFASSYISYGSKVFPLF